MPRRFQDPLDALRSRPDARQAQEELHRLAAEKLLAPSRARMPQKAWPAQMA